MSRLFFTWQEPINPDDRYLYPIVHNFVLTMTMAIQNPGEDYCVMSAVVDKEHEDKIRDYLKGKVVLSCEERG